MTGVDYLIITVSIAFVLSLLAVLIDGATRK